jgi:predicted glycogen debranching enzyme
MSSIVLGRDRLCADGVAGRLEWIATNGIGGFAAGTLSGVLARRHHGLLVAACRPPLGRTLLLAKLAERLECDGAWRHLDANRWAGGAIVPTGHLELESFRLEGTVPVWTWALGDTRLEKRVWMEQGENTTFIDYRLVEGRGPVTLELGAIVDHRDADGIRSRGEGAAAVAAAPDGLEITLDGAPGALWLFAPNAEIRPASVWYRGYSLEAEEERGLDALEDHLCAGEIAARIEPGGSLMVVASARRHGAGGPLSLASALGRRRAHDKGLIDAWKSAQPSLARHAPPWIRQLVLAADAFVVERASPGLSNGRSIVAAYPWLGDGGRDAMVALPGLTVVTGRFDIARAVLATAVRNLDQGMLPGRFAESGDPPTYDNADAALWLYLAVRAYHDATGDDAFLAEIYPALEDIGAWYERGTRHAIRVDRQDGLVRAGEPGTALTWMDATTDGWAITPRCGKAVEINALWYNALTAMVRFARHLRVSPEGYEAMAERVRRSFARFLNPETGCLFDVVDGPKGHDAAVRPNQILVLSLPDCPLAPGDRRSVLEVCGRELLTSHGLRTLSPSDRDYRGTYAGSPAARDAACHRGSAWTWLLPHFALAHERVHRDAVRAMAFLDPLSSLVAAMGVGTLPDLADGDPPHAPRGCFARAWTVAESLRAWHVLAARRNRVAGRPARRADREAVPA